MNPVSLESDFIKRRTAELKLRDATLIQIRPIVPEDRVQLRQGLDRLSPRSRFLRFLRPVGRLSNQELDYLTNIDYEDHFAWVAIAVNDPGEPGVGVARYVRDKEDPEVAEAAVAVIDDYQARGIGTILLEVLADTAQENGIARFRGYVSSENRVVLNAAEKAGNVRGGDDGAVVVEAALPFATQELIDYAVYTVLRAVARGEGSAVDRSDGAGRH